MRRDAVLAAGFGALVLSSACARRETAIGVDAGAAIPSVVHSSTAPAASASASVSVRLPALRAPPRVYVKNRFVFVRPRPDSHADWIGFLWFGASVALRSDKPVGGPGCKTYYAIEPNGFVCVDGEQATLSADDPEFVAVSRYAPRLAQAAPHRYAESTGIEFFTTLAGAEARWPTLPAFFHEARRHLLPLSTIAYSDEATIDGHDWLLSADLLWLKKEHVTLYPEITFHGVALGGGSTLPIAFFRQSGKAKYRRDAGGKLARSSETFTLHSSVALRSAVQIQRGERYFAVAEGDDWVREQDAVVPTPRSITPWGAHVGSDDHTGLAPRNARHTWIEVSVLGGWLLAYEGTRPVYATLISPGRGGIPQEGKNTLEIAATPIGTFPISGKLATVTMQAPGEYVHFGSALDPELPKAVRHSYRLLARQLGQS